jgi:D-glycero-alpha-D-manno-heptose 1-phosphate guanylyltransferase
LVTVRTEEAIVLVGGLGTRLRGMVDDLPKPLAPVAGRPFLAYVLDLLAESGLRRVLLATGYLSERVESTVGRTWRGLQIDYSVEDSPLGTGGAIARAAARLHGDSAHVFNGDTFIRFDPASLEGLVHQTGAVLGMVLAQVPDVGRYGSVDVDGEFARGFREKGASGGGLINAGSYFLTPAAISGLPASTKYSFEEDVLKPLASGRKVAVLTRSAGFIDIGVPEDYLRAQSIFGCPE